MTWNVRLSVAFVVFPSTFDFIFSFGYILADYF